MGIADNADGQNALQGAFKEGLDAPIIGEHKGSFGTTVTRALEKDGVILEIKYFHEGGDLSALPKVVTVIPKVKK